MSAAISQFRHTTFNTSRLACSLNRSHQLTQHRSACASTTAQLALSPYIPATSGSEPLP